MKLAFVVFDGITWLDLIGLYDPLSRLKSNGYRPDLGWEFCSFSKKTAADGYGLEMIPTRIGESLAGYDAILIPGGRGTRQWMIDEAFLEWIKTGSEAKYKISVCTGSLILGAAGLLKGKKATTHFNEYENLRPFCKEVLTDKIVDDDNVITAGAVSSSIDLGLHLCRKWAGSDCEMDIRRSLAFAG